MPEYLAPGVFVEEVSFRAKSIEGVGTSVAAIVGPTRFGPVRGKPEPVTSFDEFVRIYGDVQDLALGEPGDEEFVLNHTAIAAKAFFDGGGKQLFVSRITRGVNETDIDGDGSTAEFGTASDAESDVIFSARFPGEMGNFWLEVNWRDSENLLKQEVTSAPDEGEVVFMTVTGLTNAARLPGANVTTRVPDAAFPMTMNALVRRSGTQYIIHQNRCVVEADNDAALTGTDFRANDDAQGLEGRLLVAGLTAGGATVRFTRVYAKQPTNGELADGTSAVLTLSAETNLSAYTGTAHWGTLTTLRGTINEDGDTFVVDGSGLNAGVNAPVTLLLPAIAAAPSNVRAIMVQRNFDLTVRQRKLDGGPGEAIYSYANISTAIDGPNSLAAKLPFQPQKRYDQITSPIACSYEDDADIVAALNAMFNEGAAAQFLNPPPNSPEGPRYLIEMTGGSDGEVPVAVDYGGETDEVNGSTGLAAFEDVEDISIVMTPAAASHGDSATIADNHQAIIAEVQKHCRKMRYRVGIVDARDGMSLSEVRDFRSNFDDSRLALYYPWVVIADPRGIVSTINVPPAGFVAGVYANTDVQRGVHKPPANEPVIGALRFAQDINRFQQELLNPNGINCLRSFPGRGHRVWGGRTLSSDPEWMYVNVRRYFLYLERSIEKSTQWVVFEPNGERLWANVRSTVADFLYNEWFNGRLLGSSKTAYFVRCDRSTMTQNDLDNGRLVCEIGVAALKPAEFVIFRIGQKTADA